MKIVITNEGKGIIVYKEGLFYIQLVEKGISNFLRSVIREGHIEQDIRGSIEYYAKTFGRFIKDTSEWILENKGK